MKEAKDLISVIMPCYNARDFLEDAINSVLAQSYQNWELLIINDGSSDGSDLLLRDLNDSRIKVFYQENKGVVAARNVGLANMKGDFFCFLDADDLLPPDSLSSRLKCFEDQQVYFAGGGQAHFYENPENPHFIQKPEYQGNPRKGLVEIDDSCFINCGTWLIRRDKNVAYQFPEGWTHCEDLAFFLSISGMGTLMSINKVVLNYRRHSNSAMTNLKQLEKGYRKYFNFVRSNHYHKNFRELAVLKFKLKKIMFLSYIANSNYISAVKSLFA